VGYAGVTTNLSTRALALAKSEHPDLVICDIDMPQLDGGDLAKKLASDPATGDIQILFLTGCCCRRRQTPWAEKCRVARRSPNMHRCRN